jgi:sec-independent protein translocase protein TatC
LFKYIFPALSELERRKINKVLTPAILLFLAGCFFGYFLLLPPVFKILYSYPRALGAISFFTLNEFVVFTLGLTLAAGLMFLLPILMILLTHFGLVDKDFWRKNWRYAILAFLILSAIITPDGSGLTMIMLSLPLGCLYFLGYIFIK